MATSSFHLQGLPQEIKSLLFWVGSKYRTNILSRTPGGKNVIVHYKDREVLGYNNIKYPARYIDTILSNRIFSDGQRLSEIPSDEAADLVMNEVESIYSSNGDSAQYVEVWNSESQSMPWDKLDEFVSSPTHEYINDDFGFSTHNYEQDTFDALTDGQYGDYDDFNGDIGQLMDNLGF